MVESNKFCIEPELLKKSIQLKSNKKTEKIIQNILDESKSDMSLSYLSKLRNEGIYWIIYKFVLKNSIEIIIYICNRKRINERNVYASIR